jgi:hypothetical protein
MQELFYQVWLKLARTFILKDSFQSTNAKIVSPLSPRSWPSGTIICTILNLHYARKLSCKYELFWLNGSQGKQNDDLVKFLWLFLLWRGNGLLFVQFRIAFTQGWFVSSLIEIGLLVLEKILFQYKNKWIWFSLLWSLLTHGDHDLRILESTLYQKAFM